MQDLVAEYQQYQDATYVAFPCAFIRQDLTCHLRSVEEEEGEYEEEPLPEEE